MIIGIAGKKQSGKNTVANLIQYYIAIEKKPSIEELIPFKAVIEKDEIAGAAETSGWYQKGFAKKVKVIASIITGIPVSVMDSEEYKSQTLSNMTGNDWKVYVVNNLQEAMFSKKEEAVNFIRYIYQNDKMKVPDSYFKEYDITLRELLQKIGTDLFRDMIHPDVWVKALMDEYRPIDYESKVDPDRVNNATYQIPIYPNWIITDVRFPNEVSAVKEEKGLIIKVVRPLEGELHSNHASETALNDYSEWDWIINNDGNINKLAFEVTKMLREFKLIC